MHILNPEIRYFSYDSFSSPQGEIMSTPNNLKTNAQNNRSGQNAAAKPATNGQPRSAAVIVAPALSSTAKPISHAQIEERAYRLWQQRGCPNGDDKQDWFRAERELGVILKR